MGFKILFIPAGPRLIDRLRYVRKHKIIRRVTMATKFIDNNEIDNIDSPENCASESEIIKKHPQYKYNCDGCRKSIGELEPFDKPEDSSDDISRLFGEPEPYEEFLVCGYRRFGTKRNYMWDIILDKYFAGCNSEEDSKKARELMIKRYGYKKYFTLTCYSQSLDECIKTLECRDCCQLSDEEFWRSGSPLSLHEKINEKIMSLVLEVLCGVHYIFWVLSGKKF